MTEDLDKLTRTAKQLIDAERLIGGDFIPADRNPLPVIEATQPAPADTVGAEQKAQVLSQLQAEAQACDACGLGSTRNKLVFGQGNPDADIVFVGEAPGAEENATGKPFVGRAGELLTKMIKAMGLDRKDIYICNMLKCRPPGNRTPNPQEIECCWPLLIRQLQIIKPEVIVTLGNPSTKGLLGTREGITRMRGNWRKLPDIGEGLAGIDVMPTFHPAYVLRQYTPDNRRKVWSDLQAVMERLGLTGPNAAAQ